MKIKELIFYYALLIFIVKILGFSLWMTKKLLQFLEKILGGSNRKPNNLLVDKGSEFYNASMKIWLKHDDMEIYLTRFYII